MGHDEQKYPMKRIMDAAELASSLKSDAVPALVEALGDKDGAVRYWGAMGMLMRGPDGVDAARDALHRALDDPSPYVRAVAAQALGQYGDDEEVSKALRVLIQLASQERGGIYVPLAALNALDALDERAEGAVDAIRALPQGDRSVPARMRAYVPNLIRKTLADLE